LIQNILVFEFITGGGLSRQELPDSLVKEGLLMLKALVNELVFFTDIQLTITLDWRICGIELPKNIKVIKVSKEQCIYDLLPDLIEDSDSIWPIAPEIDGVLYKITQLIEQKNKQLLNSSSQAIAICGDKLATIKCLSSKGIATVASQQLNEFSQDFDSPWVVKSKDGVGCLDSYFVSDNDELVRVNKQIKCHVDYLIQPYVNGQSLSLSCLFKEGKAWLISCNIQVVSINNGAFVLERCIVNIDTENFDVYQKLIDQIADIIPGLSAYVGIDIIQPEDAQPLVLEINPRLTTSYVGINQAIGCNVAKTIIKMTEFEPVIKKTCNKQITVLTN